MTDPAAAISQPRTARKWRPVAAIGVCLIGLAAWLYVLHDLWRPGAVTSAAAAPQPFKLERLVIPRDEILSGGPRKDGIPALTYPRMLSPRGARYLKPNDRVIGVALGGQTRAYPLRILNWHEVVNDRVGGIPVAVTYCPLCDSVALLDGRDGAAERQFGVSGLLYNSNVLIYNRGAATESLWSQMMLQGVSGPGARRTLKTLPVELTTWRDWKSRHPATKVLSNQTGHARDYNTNPYSQYFREPEVRFPVRPRSNRLPAKQPVLGVWTAGRARAYPLSAFGADQPVVVDTLDDRRLTLRYNPGAKSLRVEKADEGLQWVYSLWFAWYAFHPNTDVYPAAGDGSP